ncbi:hypothetical protein [Selenomonas montiformis]|uniref:hypothetical protein n=1 Tax=Selenomonas montiformis TaxID=2652285 RepID=UPI0018A6D5A4|nr:hypothetical protein [Selenomonas montiformis]
MRKGKSDENEDSLCRMPVDAGHPRGARRKAAQDCGPQGGRILPPCATRRKTIR